MALTETDILEALVADEDIQAILHILSDLQLKDSWLCAGTVRNFIWNLVLGRDGFDRETDIDIIFYDKGISYDETCQIEEGLKANHPQYKWEVKNQVYMHMHNPNTLAYTSSQDAMSKYPETCTAIGLRLVADGQLDLFCPYGLEDICEMRVKPTPHFLADEERMALYHRRLAKKDWFQKWPQLNCYEK